MAGSEVTERVEKTGVREEGEPVTMTCVSRTVPGSERFWIPALPAGPTRSVQRAGGRWRSSSYSSFLSSISNIIVSKLF